jgi:membrane-associated phospholipid phosphatase
MDRSILDWVVTNRPDWVIDVATFLHHIGDDTVLVPVTLVLLAAGFLTGRSSARTVAPFVSMVATVIVVGLAKAVFDRDRPPLAGRLVETSSASMPSGHAGYAAALAATAWVLLAGHPRKRLLRCVAVGLAAAAAVARVVLGVHWPSDVLVGSAIGAAVGSWVALGAVKRLQSRA